MKIVGLEITGFGPLADKKLTFSDGMNVLFGPNESAKTAIHSACFAGLCGIRRGQGQPKREDKAFESRHRPWDGGPWKVAALTELGDGRKIKLTHDLAGRLGSKAVDVSNGDDLSSEIQFEGSIDGSVWLGLNRRSFRATACVRQAEIVAALADDDDHREDISALQQALQRAATSAGQRDETASAALKALNEFWRENVGHDDGRSAKRPYRRCKGEVDQFEQALRDARTAHAQYLELLEARDLAIADRETRQRAVSLAEAAVERAKAAALEAKAARANELQQKHPSAPSGASADQTLANQVSEALTLWDTAPPAPSLSGKSSAELGEELTQLPERPDGELVPAQDVVDAAGELVVARRLLAHHIEAKPSASTSSEPPTPAAAEADVVSAQIWRRARIPMIAVACFALAGVASAALGALAVGAALLVAAVAVAGASLWFLRPRTGNAPSTPATSATPMPQVDLGAAWAQHHDELAQQLAGAEQALLAALRRHELALGDGESVEAAVERYKAECAKREEQDRAARRREQLTLALDQRKRAEEQIEVRQAAVTALRAAAASAGLEETDPTAAAGALRSWQGRQHQELESHDEGQREWSELEQLLAGGTLVDLKERAKQARLAANRAAAPFAGDELDPLDPQTSEAELPRLRREHQAAVEMAAARAQLAASEGGKLTSVAEAEAELDEAKEKLTQVVALDQTLKATIGYLTEAQRRVYETIAPLLTKTLKQWLPQVAVYTDGARPEPRYDDAYIEPQTLALRVRLGNGPWRDADLLSAGTREQIYLLLRVALAEHLVKVGEVVPLLLDEVTAQCDSTRRKALLELLLDLSAQRQIILFTHDDAVHEWAKATLPAGAVQTLQPITPSTALALEEAIAASE